MLMVINHKTNNAYNMSFVSEIGLQIEGNDSADTAALIFWMDAVKFKAFTGTYNEVRSAYQEIIKAMSKKNPHGSIDLW